LAVNVIVVVDSETVLLVVVVDPPSGVLLCEPELLDIILATISFPFNISNSHDSETSPLA